jgi:DNA polymerase V
LCVGFDILCLENKEFKGEVVTDFYGRQIPKGVHGTVSFVESTNSSAKILDGILALFDKIMDSSMLVRRLNICANDVILQANVQPSLFDKTEEDNTESKLQQTVLHIHKKFGKNALLKAYDFEECATARQRNAQIGGHKA